MKRVILISIVASLALLSGCGSSNTSIPKATSQVATTSAVTTKSPTTEAPTTEAPTTQPPVKEVSAVEYLGKSKSDIIKEFGNDYQKAQINGSGLTEFFYYPDKNVPYIFGVMQNKSIIDYIYIIKTDEIKTKVYGDIYSDMTISDLLLMNKYDFTQTHMDIDNTDTVSCEVDGYSIGFIWSGGTSGTANKVRISKTVIEEPTQPATEKKTEPPKKESSNKNTLTGESLKNTLCNSKWHLDFVTDLNGNKENSLSLYGTIMYQAGAKIEFKNDDTFSCVLGQEGAGGTYSVNGEDINFHVDQKYTGYGPKDADYNFTSQYTSVYNPDKGENVKAVSLRVGDYIDYFVII